MTTHTVCYYCGFGPDKRVEAGGMWHCPNVLCTGPGSSYWRSRLPSYREVGGERHTVDPAEAAARGREYAETLPEGDALRSHILASVGEWLSEYAIPEHWIAP